MSRLPNPLIIGVQKSSTSWLAARLAQHPDVFMVRREVHFFDNPENYRKGYDWYANQFSKATSETICCEKTGAYFWTTCEDYPAEPKDKPERIRSLLPSAKLITLLRDPVKRAVSAWNHIVRTGAIDARINFEDLFSESIQDLVSRHGILTRGLYYHQLKRFLEIFPRDQLLVLFQEKDVIEDPKGGLQKLCTFLGIDSTYQFERLEKAENRFDGTLVANRIAAQFPMKWRRYIHSIDKRLLTRLPIEKLKYPQPSEALLARLVDYYAQDTRKLAKLVGPVPSVWLGSGKADLSVENARVSRDG